MAKEQEKLEQHPLAKLFPSPDSGTLDALKKRIFHAGKLKTPVVLFEGKVIEHWPEYGACVEFGLPFTTTEYSGTEDELVEHLLQTNTLQLGKVHRALIGAYLKKLYRKKSQANQSAGGFGATFIPKYHARDVAAEKMKISPRLIADAEQILDTENDKLLELALAGTLSISNLVYMRWDYELGKLTLKAAWDTIQRFDEETKIYTLKSGRQVLAETEIITITHTAEIAKSMTNAINRKGFCSGLKVLRKDSYIPACLTEWGRSLWKN